jgi:transposase
LLVKLMNWCKEALRLKKQWPELTDPAYELKASRLEDRLDGLMKLKPKHEESKQLAKQLARHRPELTRFLWAKDLEGTNNPAERALRPAVVMRKITGGSRSEAGAAAWAKLASLLRTADERKPGVFDAAKKLITDYGAEAGR